MKMFDYKDPKNLASVALLIGGIVTYAQWMKEGKGQQYPVVGLAMVLTASILSLSVRYNSKKADGSKGELKDKGSHVVLLSLCLGVLLGVIIPLVRKYRGYNDPQRISMGIGMILLCVGTLQSLFIKV